MSWPKLQPLRTASLAAALVCGLVNSASAQADAGADATPDAATPSSESQQLLAPLPAVPSQDLPPPTPESLEAVKDLLSRVVSEDPVIRERAVRELVEADPKWVPALAHTLGQLAESTKGEELKRKLLDIRDNARSAEREKMKAAGKRGKIVTPDYMDMLAEHPEPKNAEWQAVTQVIAISRMLREIATTPAVRTLIQVYVRFGEFLRVDTQLQIEKLGDKALPALIETRRHQAPRIAHWADRQLDALGKAIPSEAVQTPDPDVLADVLRAYGYTRDPDAARVVISFANSERPQVREASRQAVALMKEIANWPLRDTYANIVGRKPPADWGWDRTARELFGEFDRLRLAQVYKLFDTGKAAQKAGKLIEAKEAFDKVLARSPLFDRRAEMIDTYVDFAEQKIDEDPAAAEAALRRARRLSTDEKVDNRVQSLLWYLEGQDLVARGVADQVPFRRALELNPENKRAKTALEEIQRGEQKQKKKGEHYLAAGAIGIVALLAIAVIALRRGSPEPRLPEKPEIKPVPDDEASSAEGADEAAAPASNEAPVSEAQASASGGEEAPATTASDSVGPEDPATETSVAPEAPADAFPEARAPASDSSEAPSPPTPVAAPEASPAVATLHFPTVTEEPPADEPETAGEATPSAEEPESGAEDSAAVEPPEPLLPPLPGLEGGGLKLPPIDED
ncbi:MAG: hypothetical protein AB7K71_20025 [Polyangiaceae bacterium]